MDLKEIEEAIKATLWKINYYNNEKTKNILELKMQKILFNQLIKEEDRIKDNLRIAEIEKELFQDEDT
jgi:hypothetical protein